MPKWTTNALQTCFSSLEGFLLPASSDFYLHIPYKGWADNPLKKSLSAQGGFAPYK
jgi:hypothetical protein